MSIEQHADSSNTDTQPPLTNGHDTSGAFDEKRRYDELTAKLLYWRGELHIHTRELAHGALNPEGLTEKRKQECGAVLEKAERRIGEITGELKLLNGTHDDGVGTAEAEEEPFSTDARDESDAEKPLKEGEFRAVVLCAADIEAEIVQYLWYPYLHLGKLGLLGGDSGMGKSYLTAAIATALSLGRWPFFLNGKDSVKDPGNTLIFSAEDGIADTYIPRLTNLGADLSRIHFVKGKKDWQGNLHRVVLNDKKIITGMIQDHEAKFVVFDPLQSFLPRGAKMNDMETVRPVLDSLTDAAAETHCHIQLAGHLSKAKQETASYKFLGSVDWFNAARSVLMAVPNPENPATERFLYHVKNSLGVKAPGMGFSIAETNEPIFMWGKTADVSLEDVLAGTTNPNQKLEQAEEFLRGELAFGEKLAEDIYASAKLQKISRNALWEAKKILKITAHKNGYQGPWMWELPG